MRRSPDNQQRKTGFVRLILLPMISVVVGCGGGSETPAPSRGTQSPLLTGTFLDSPVAGLAYSTPTRTGITDPAGHFEYRAGETVTFSLYGQSIGEATGGPILTPFNLRPPTDHPEFALNVIRLLQTLDSDGDPSNGIDLPPLAGSMNINLAQATLDFSADAGVSGFIGTRVLVSASAATAHFQSTIASGNPGYAVNLAGRTASSRTSFSFCPGASLRLSYAFGENTYARTFDPASAVCDGGTSILSPPDELSFSGPYPSDSTSAISCGPTCTYADLNRVVLNQPEGTDPSTTYNLVIQHVPGSKVITAVQTHLHNALPVWSFREEITLD